MIAFTETYETGPHQRPSPTLPVREGDLKKKRPTPTLPVREGDLKKRKVNEDKNKN